MAEPFGLHAATCACVLAQNHGSGRVRALPIVRLVGRSVWVRGVSISCVQDPGPGNVKLPRLKLECIGNFRLPCATQKNRSPIQAVCFHGRLNVGFSVIVSERALIIL